MPRLLLKTRRDQFRYTAKVKGIAPANLLAYWALAEPSGATVAADGSGNGRTGAYNSVTLAQPGIGDGRTAASFDGSASYCNIYGASLAAAFNGAEGTIALWAKVSAVGVWSDGAARRLISFLVDVNNQIQLRRNNAAANQILAVYVAGGTTKSVTITPGPETGWFHLALTWSASADQVKAYLNGAQVGATLTGLGTWAGSLSASQTLIAANTTTTLIWSGFEQHVALWNTPLSATQIAAIAGN